MCLNGTYLPKQKLIWPSTVRVSHKLCERNWWIPDMCGHLGYGQTIYWQFRNWLSSGNDAWSFFQQWSAFFPLFPGAISAIETLNVIFLSRSCIKLYSLALCIIQCLSTFRLKLLSKILFLQFWRHFPPYAVINAVFRIIQKMLINIFCHLEGFIFLFAVIPGKL